jgi:KTSC domain
MERKPVESSHFAAVGYDPAAREMEIEFKNGAVYSYHGVPREFHDTMMNADSHGAFFHKNVKPFFKARKIS